MRRLYLVYAFAGALAVLTGASCGGAKGGSSSASGGSTPPGGDTSPANSWSVTTDAIRLTVALESAQGLRVTELRNLSTNRDWSSAAQADTVLTVNGSAVGLGTSDGFKFTGADRSSDDSGTELRLTFEHPSLRLRAVRHYISYTGTSVIETFTDFQSVGGSASVGPLNAWRLTVPAGTLTWVQGLINPDDPGSNFAVKHRRLGAGERLDLGAEGRSSRNAVPWIDVEAGDGEHLFGGLMWSGAWALSVSATSDRQEMTLGLAPMTVALQNGVSVEGPHGFFGVAAADGGAVPRAMREFFTNGVRLGRPLSPLIKYNTWFASGARIDENQTRLEIEHAANLKAELYVLDAGWYQDGGWNGKFDFNSGLGNWKVDENRFPSGLGALRDYAHSLGLKFGIWVEPERVALETVGVPGLADERWLAKRDGVYDPSPAPDETPTAQICLAHPDAKAWVLDRVLTLIDEVKPDYLKWDNNFWINCNRTGHGHGTTDANFAHVRALYEILAAVRERYPDLLIENCSGGGYRLDFGIARYTDTGWMDDRTTPSEHVRHNIEGLSTIFPAPYLFSFVVGDRQADDPVPEDIPLLYRSRMPGALGIGTGMSPEQEQRAAREIQLYHTVRAIQQDAFTVALTPPAQASDNVGWDALLQVSATGSAVLFAFQDDPDVTSILLSPKGLNPNLIYGVRSADSGNIGQASGADLIEQGIEVVSSPYSAAHLLFFDVVGEVPPAARVAARSRAAAASTPTAVPRPRRDPARPSARRPIRK